MAKTEENTEQTDAAAWTEFLDTLDPFTREQVELADTLDVEYRAVVEKREANRELLRYLAKSGKVDRAVVDDLYKPKQITRPRKKKGETAEEYKARTGIDLPAS